jgi:hypothetical protein
MNVRGDRSTRHDHIDVVGPRPCASRQRQGADPCPSTPRCPHLGRPRRSRGRSLGGGLKLALLVVRGLLVGGNPKVDRCAHGSSPRMYSVARADFDAIRPKNAMPIFRSFLYGYALSHRVRNRGGEWTPAKPRTAGTFYCGEPTRSGTVWAATLAWHLLRFPLRDAESRLHSPVAASTAANERRRDPAHFGRCGELYCRAARGSASDPLGPRRSTHIGSR